MRTMTMHNGFATIPCLRCLQGQHGGTPTLAPAPHHPTTLKSDWAAKLAHWRWHFHAHHPAEFLLTVANSGCVHAASDPPTRRPYPTPFQGQHVGTPTLTPSDVWHLRSLVQDPLRVGTPTQRIRGSVRDLSRADLHYEPKLCSHVGHGHHQ